MTDISPVSQISPRARETSLARSDRAMEAAQKLEATFLADTSGPNY